MKEQQSEHKVNRPEMDAMDDLININLWNVHSVDQNSTTTDLNDTREGKRHGRLSGSCATNNAHFEACGYIESEIAETELCRRAIPERYILELNSTNWRPLLQILQALSWLLLWDWL